MTEAKAVAIVTGGGAGIGKATAARFAREGYRVVVVDRDEQDGRAVAEQLSAAGAEARYVHADIASEPQCRSFAEAALRAFGRIDVLVANAGIRVFGTILEATEEDWDRILAVNLKGTGFSCKAVLPAMIEQRSGALVLVGSTTAIMGRVDMPLYDATKMGILSLTRSLASAYGRYGIRVNAVCPSRTLTDFHFRKAAAEGISAEEVRRRHVGYGLLGRAGEPEDIAGVIHFLAGKDAAFVTGQSLMVDGGFSVGTKAV